MKGIRQQETVKGRVSVVTPVYNGETYLSPMLDSILEQTYPYMEVILVDDGSTDRTVEIAKGYEKLPMEDRIGIIAQAFGCTSGKIETSPCTGKWRGTSDISIKLDKGTSLFIGNHRTPQAKTAKVQNECINSALVRYNPEIISATKEAAIAPLKKRETKDNAI